MPKPRRTTLRNFMVLLDELDADKPIKLRDLIALLEGAITKYGKEAIVKFDAGHNNIDVKIQPSKSGKWDESKRWMEDNGNVNFKTSVKEG